MSISCSVRALALLALCALAAPSCAWADDSGGKNAYLYFDPVGGLIHHVPWDFNHSLGQTWQTEREASNRRR